jgi:hypothetical protein
MTRLAVALLLLVQIVLHADARVQCVYWTQGPESRAALQTAGVTQICVAPDRVDAWRGVGFTAIPMSDADLASREALPTPGLTPRPGVASPTRSPWIVANGWRFARRPAAKYVYNVPAGRAAIAAAEAAAYSADAVIKLDAADLASVGSIQTFLESLAFVDLPAVSDLAIVDDGSAVTGEVMNLLTRRNLLFQVVEQPAARLPLTIRIGSPEYPREQAADPSTFVLKIRRQLTDEQRSLRVYGTEVVLCRLTADAGRARLHLVNYSGRDIEGLRLRLRGAYAEGEAHIAGVGRAPLQDQVVADGATELTLPRIATYAIVDLRATR